MHSTEGTINLYKKNSPDTRAITGQITTVPKKESKNSILFVFATTVIQTRLQHFATDNPLIEKCNQLFLCRSIIAANGEFMMYGLSISYVTSDLSKWVFAQSS
jgi:hypothetical protein